MSSVPRRVHQHAQLTADGQLPVGDLQGDLVGGAPVTAARVPVIPEDGRRERASPTEVVAGMRRGHRPPASDAVGPRPG